MPKYYLGIDPGLTHTGLALIDAQGQVLGIALVLVKPTAKMKAHLGFKKKVDTTNYKLVSIFTRVQSELQTLFETHGVVASDVVTIIEGFWYRPDVGGNRKASNFVYETVAGVAATKCALIQLSLSYHDIMPVQVKRIISWLGYGTPQAELDKLAVENAIKKILGTEQVDDVLRPYAKGYHQHLADAIAIALCAKNLQAYEEYMKIPCKKRKAMKKEN